MSLADKPPNLIVLLCLVCRCEVLLVWFLQTIADSNKIKWDSLSSPLITFHRVPDLGTSELTTGPLCIYKTTKLRMQQHQVGANILEAFYLHISTWDRNLKRSFASAGISIIFLTDVKYT